MPTGLVPAGSAEDLVDKILILVVVALARAGQQQPGGIAQYPFKRGRGQGILAVDDVVSILGAVSGSDAE